MPSTVMSTYPSLDMFDDVPNLASGVPLHYHFYVTEITYLPVREDPKASETPN